MASVLNQAYFHDEKAAFEALEGIIWPNGPVCQHCGATDRINRLPVQRTKPSKKNPNGKPVYGLWKCYHCRGQFNVRKNTIFATSHLELRQWFQCAFRLGCRHRRTTRSGCADCDRDPWFSDRQASPAYARTHPCRSPACSATARVA